MNRPQLKAQAIKTAVPPLEFYRDELDAMPQPKHAGGWADGGLCPFHEDRHAGNFRVNLDCGAFHCFACGAKGADVIAFLQLRDGVTFSEALRTLADNWSVFL